MKSNSYVKKIIASVSAISLLTSFQTITSYAYGAASIDEYFIELNKEPVRFHQMLKIKYDIVYIPLRLAFVNNAGVYIENGMEIETLGFDSRYATRIQDEEEMIDNKMIEINMRRKSNENDYLNDEGRYVRIEWGDDVKKEGYTNGKIYYWKYKARSEEEGGNKGYNDGDYHFTEALDHEPDFDKVNVDGDRILLSVTDIQKIVKFLSDGNDYEVLVDAVYEQYNENNL